MNIKHRHVTKHALTAITVGLAFALSTSLAIAGGPVTAPPPPQAYNVHQGMYASANLGIGLGAERQTSGAIAGGFTGVGGNIFLGYQFNQYVAVEAGASAIETILGSLSFFDLAVKGILPLGQRWTIFGKVGGAIALAHACLFGICSTSSKGAVFLAAGAGYAWTQHLSSTLQYNSVILTSNSSDGLIGLLTLGLTYHFS